MRCLGGARCGLVCSLRRWRSSVGSRVRSWNGCLRPWPAPDGCPPNSHRPSRIAPHGPAIHRNHRPFALWLPIAVISQMTNSSRLTEAQEPQAAAPGGRQPAVLDAGDDLRGPVAIRRMDSSGRWYRSMLGQVGHQLCRGRRASWPRRWRRAAPGTRRRSAGPRRGAHAAARRPGPGRRRRRASAGRRGITDSLRAVPGLPVRPGLEAAGSERRAPDPAAAAGPAEPFPARRPPRSAPRARRR